METNSIQNREQQITCSNLEMNNKGMTQKQIFLVQQTWKIFRKIRPEIIGDVFYSKLFVEMPALEKLFVNPLSNQYKKLIDMISLVVGRLHNFDEITNDIRELAKRHVGYGVKPAHYKLVGEALLWTLQQGLGKDWNEEVKEAWEQCYKIMSDTMIEAAKS